MATGRQLKAPLSSKVAFVPTATLPVPIAFVLEINCTAPRSTKRPPLKVLLAASTSGPAPALRSACAPEIAPAAVNGWAESFVQVCPALNWTRLTSAWEPSESASIAMPAEFTLRRVPEKVSDWSAWSVIRTPSTDRIPLRRIVWPEYSPV